MELNRKPFQGLINIIRFNWHFYAIACLVIMAIVFSIILLPHQTKNFSIGLLILTLFITFSSLLISCYVYDFSGFYKLKWLPNLAYKKVITVNAGFDETSQLIKQKFPTVSLTACDFFDPKKHTEISIRRARKAYPPIEGTTQVSSNKLPFPDHSFDYALAILSAHEIRNDAERILFFSELHRVIKPNGQIHIIEHLRDFNNFIAYTIGFLHFHSKTKWLTTFAQSNLTPIDEMKITPFITSFRLNKNGNTL